MIDDVILVLKRTIEKIDDEEWKLLLAENYRQFELLDQKTYLNILIPNDFG